MSGELQRAQKNTSFVASLTRQLERWSTDSEEPMWKKDESNQTNNCSSFTLSTSACVTFILYIRWVGDRNVERNVTTTHKMIEWCSLNALTVSFVVRCVLSIGWVDYGRVETSTPIHSPEMAQKTIELFAAKFYQCIGMFGRGDYRSYGSYLYRFLYAGFGIM